jgi:hypothetical protein
VLLYEFLSCHKIKCHCRYVSAALIFDVLILVINSAGLYYFKSICTFEKLLCRFDSLLFTCKYAVLSLIVAIVLGVIAGMICRLYLTKKHCTCKKGKYR